MEYINNLVKNNKIEIEREYNQKIEGRNSHYITCEDENIALDVQSFLKEQILKY